jgi:hypothetical protein
MSRSMFVAFVAAAAFAATRIAGAQSLPAPASVFGHPVGADSQLVTYDQSIEYLRRLASANPYVRLMDVGKT